MAEASASQADGSLNLAAFTTLLLGQLQPTAAPGSRARPAFQLPHHTGSGGSGSSAKPGRTRSFTSDLRSPGSAVGFDMRMLKGQYARKYQARVAHKKRISDMPISHALSPSQVSSPNTVCALRSALV